MTTKSFKEEEPTTFDQAGDAAAAERPALNCFGNIESQGTIKTKINMKAGRNVLAVDFRMLFLKIKRKIT